MRRYCGFLVYYQRCACVGAGLRSEDGAWLRLLCTWSKAPDGLPAFVRREEKRLADTIGIGWHLGSRSILSRGISRANKK